MADTNEILSRWRAAGFELRLEPAPAGWRCVVREGAGAWSSLRAAHSGFPQPLDAAVDADARLTTLVAARSEASTVETLESLEVLVAEDRLARGAPRPDGTASWLVTLDIGEQPVEVESPRAAAELESTRSRTRPPRPAGSLRR